MSQLIYCNRINNTKSYRIDSIKKTLKDLQDEVDDLKDIVKNFKKISRTMGKERNPYTFFHHQTDRKKRKRNKRIYQTDK